MQMKVRKWYRGIDQSGECASASSLRRYHSSSSTGFRSHWPLKDIRGLARVSNFSGCHGRDGHAGCQEMTDPGLDSTCRPSGYRSAL